MKKDSHITRTASHILYTSYKYICGRVFENNSEIKTMSVRAFFSRNHIRTRTQTSAAIQLWLCFLLLCGVSTTLLCWVSVVCTPAQASDRRPQNPTDSLGADDLLSYILQRERERIPILPASRMLIPGGNTITQRK